MNRIQLLDLQLDERKSAFSHDQTFAEHEACRAPSHRFFVPLHYEKNYAYPLLIWLHGPTGNEHEIKHVMPHISMRNYVGVSLRGVVRHPLCDAAGDLTYTWDQDPQNVEYATEDVLECIRLARNRFNIAADRVFLVGNDAGGTMALRLALNISESFAGVASIGGKLPTTNQPLALVNRARSVPMMLAHCRDSESYPTSEVCQDLRLLHAAGVQVTLRQYPCQQEVTTQMLIDLNAWVMEHVSGIPATSPDLIDDPTHMRLEDRN